MSRASTFFFPLLFTCVDVCILRGLRSLQLSPHFSIPCPPLTAMWTGELIRAVLLLLLLLLLPPRGPSWAGGFGSLQSVLVLCLHLPVYVTLLRALGWGAEEEMWAWHSWERVFQGYLVMVVSWIYWTQYVQSMVLSLSHFVMSAWRPSCKDQKPKNGTTSSLRRLLGFMRPHLGYFAVVLLLVGLSSFCEMAVPLYMGQITDWIQNQEKPDVFTEAITMIAVMTLVSGVLEFIGDLMYNATMSHIHTAVQGDVLQAILNQEIAFFDATPTGELVSRITTDTNTMSEALSEKLSLLMWYTGRVVFLFYFMVKQSWKMSLLTSLGLPVIWVVPKLTAHFHQALSVKVQESLAKANQVATETFSCIKTVKSFANEDGETERYTRCMEELYALNKMESVMYAATTSANSLTTLVMKVCILYYGGVMVTRGAISSGELVAFVLYELQFASVVDALMQSYPEVKKAIGGSEKIFEYLDRKPQVPPEGTLAPEHLMGHVQFKNVTFSYSGNNDPDSVILKGVSLEIKPGKITALVGLNRAGKSTCVRLLERFYQPRGGQILLDGKPLDSYKDAYLRQKISVVSQDCALFARSVRENIKYGCSDASDEDMHEAARLASAHDFITGLSKDYDTDAGEKGGQLSGGQKQRIAIARALIRRPTVLVLDNATSDLDTENEHQVFQALLSQDLNSFSVLLISNKMSVVEKADHIVVLHQGAVVAEGRHHQLLERSELYARLVKKGA
ncbi:antigen peptide transporter 1 isoform X2 [Syngnathoides biaculeatus]|nr:antigen peptide transporter 1 isoform X2 [Syngnathoides biaculeatus]XP_061677175.1 antigen peptide transporter 1 isoform X2 [Syngnathoides biaculeatus]